MRSVPSAGQRPRSRAQASAASTSSTVRSPAPRVRRAGRVLGEHRGHRVDDAGERQPARRGTPRRTPRWPRCRPRARCRRAPPPRGRGVRRGTPRRRAGRTPRSGPWSSPPAAPARGPGPASARPSAIGISIVGGLACASVEPSVNSTIECTTTRRVHDDLDPVERDVEEQVRLDHLQALVDQGRGVDRHDGSHVPRRVAQRLLRSDLGSSSRVRPRKGPPLAVRTRRRTSSARPPRRHWASALCSLSTGTI